MNGNTVYGQFNPPRLTQARRLALVQDQLLDGALIYQTDGAAGIYTYHHPGGWASPVAATATGEARGAVKLAPLPGSVLTATGWQGAGEMPPEGVLTGAHWNQIRRLCLAPAGSAPAPAAAAAAALRNVAPEAAVTTSSNYPRFLNPRSLLVASFPPDWEWGSGTHGWNDNTPGSFPDWVELSWPAPVAIESVTVRSLGGTQPPYYPGRGEVGGPYGLRDYQVQAWVESGWQVLETVSGNATDLRVHAVRATTTRLRVLITDSVDRTYSRLTQLVVMAREG